MSEITLLSEDEQKFEESIYHYFVWKLSKLDEKQSSSWLNIEENAGDKDEAMGQHQDEIYLESERQKCKQMIDILRGESDTTSDDTLKSTVPSVLEGWSTLTKSTQSRKRPRNEDSEDKENELAGTSDEVMESKEDVKKEQTGDALNDGGLENELEFIVDLVQSTNANEITQLRSQVESQKNELLSKEEKYSIERHKLAKIQFIVQKKDKTISSLREKLNDIKKKHPYYDAPTDGRFDKRWEKNFQKVAEHIKQHGHEKLRNLCSLDPKLNGWVSKQRYAYTYKLPTLTQDKIDKLNSIGFIWSPWEHQFQKLAEFIKIHGHAGYNIINKNKYPGIYDWVTSQRRAYHEKLPSLTKEKIERLNSIGFVWTSSKPFVTFEMWLEQCRQFKARHGHLNVPFLHELNADGSEPTEEEKYFRIWAQNMRNRYKKFIESGTASMKLNKQVIEALNELGFDWRQESIQGEIRDVAKERFADRVAQLKKVAEVCGTCNDKKSIFTVYPNGHSLKVWVQTIRRQYHKWTRGEKSTLTQERIQMLESIGFDFDPRRHYAPPKTTTYKTFKSLKLENNEYHEAKKLANSNNNNSEAVPMAQGVAPMVPMGGVPIASIPMAVLPIKHRPDNLEILAFMRVHFFEKSERFIVLESHVTLDTTKENCFIEQLCLLGFSEGMHEASLSFECLLFLCWGQYTLLFVYQYIIKSLKLPK